MKCFLGHTPPLESLSPRMEGLHWSREPGSRAKTRCPEKREAERPQGRVVGVGVGVTVGEGVAVSGGVAVGVGEGDGVGVCTPLRV